MAYLDPLCCNEENWDPIVDDGGAAAEDLFFSPADEEIAYFSALSSKEVERRRDLSFSRLRAATAVAGDDPYLGGGGGGGGRRAAVEWVLSAAARHGFSPATATAAVDYLDRCFISGDLRLSNDRPWMPFLAAVGCLSLAAKMEETHVPHVIVLQLGACYVFDARTVRRMELLVLSSLKWRMFSITPFSFLLPLLAGEPLKLLRSCENVLISAAAEARWLRFLPSVWAAAALIHAGGGGDISRRLITLTNADEDNVDSCRNLIREMMKTTEMVFSNPRSGISSNTFSSLPNFYQYNDEESRPPSPSGVIGSCFSADSSSSSFSGDPPPAPDQPPFKKHKS